MTEREGGSDRSDWIPDQVGNDKWGTGMTAKRFESLIQIPRGPFVKGGEKGQNVGG
jgi:hypothetical protein